MKKSESIKTILKRYKNQWLLIELDKVDERVLKPKTGWLIGHSPRKEDLFEAMTTHHGRLFSVYSGPVLPAGFKAAF
jgi:hypothetical protein